MTRFLMMTLAVGTMSLVAGCTSEPEFTDYSLAEPSENTGDGHDHGAHEGAHGGQVIEFDAAHAHHAEVVFDEASRDITLYFYGAEIGEAHSASELVVELEEGDEEIHLEVAASPLEGETDETSSRFVVAGAGLPDNVKTADDLHGHFHVTLDGQDFKGDLCSHHSHGEHGEHGSPSDHDEGHDEHGDDHDGDKAE